MLLTELVNQYVVLNEVTFSRTAQTRSRTVRPVKVSIQARRSSPCMSLADSDSAFANSVLVETGASLTTVTSKIRLYPILVRNDLVTNQ